MRMKKKLLHYCFRTAAVLSILATLLFAGREMLAHFQSPPAAPQAQRQLLTVWLRAGDIPAASWLRERAAAFQKTHQGISIWLRIVSPEDLALLETTAPDLVFFAAGESISPAFLSPLTPVPYLGKHAKSGIYETTLLAAPVCLSGYALVMQTQEAAQTPAPTSIFGVTLAPDVSASVATPLPGNLWPHDITADNALGAGLLSLINAPSGAQLLEKNAVQNAFLQDKTQAALLTLQQARAVQAQGKGLQLLSSPPATDLVLFGSITHSASPAAQNFLSYLLSEESQRALHKYNLFPTRQGIHLYGSNTPIAQAIEHVLQAGWLPNAFSWPTLQESTILTAQALYTEGNTAAALFIP